MVYEGVGSRDLGLAFRPWDFRVKRQSLSSLVVVKLTSRLLSAPQENLGCRISGFLVEHSFPEETELKAQGKLRLC